MSVVQVTPNVEESTKTRDNVIPSRVIKGLRPHPFGLVFNGRWRFDSKRKRWAPRMLMQNLIPGLNGITESGKSSSGRKILNTRPLSERAAKSNTHQFFDREDKRLGEFKEFRHSFLTKRDSGRLIDHYCLKAETYTKDSRGNYRRSVDPTWIDRLHDHVVKAGLIQPMPYEDLLEEIARLEKRIGRLRIKLLSTTTHRETSEIFIKQNESLIKDMQVAYKKQFPKGKAESEMQVVVPSTEFDSESDSNVVIDTSVEDVDMGL